MKISTGIDRQTSKLNVENEENHKKTNFLIKYQIKQEKLKSNY
jgi:hypothetical protein